MVKISRERSAGDCGGSGVGGRGGYLSLHLHGMKTVSYK